MLQSVRARWLNSNNNARVKLHNIVSLSNNTSAISLLCILPWSCQWLNLCQLLQLSQYPNMLFITLTTHLNFSCTDISPCKDISWLVCRQEKLFVLCSLTQSWLAHVWDMHSCLCGSVLKYDNCYHANSLAPLSWLHTPTILRCVHSSLV